MDPHRGRLRDTESKQGLSGRPLGEGPLSGERTGEAFPMSSPIWALENYPKVTQRCLCWSSGWAAGLGRTRALGEAGRLP